MQRIHESFLKCTSGFTAHRASFSEINAVLLLISTWPFRNGGSAAIGVKMSEYGTVP